VAETDVAITTFYCIYSIFIFVVKNMDMFITNSDMHGIHTRQGIDLHYPTCKLAKVQKGVSYTGIRILNNLPHNIKIFVKGY
jgi:hypothetical protein